MPTGVEIVLVEALPDRLRYLLTTIGTLGPTTILPNAALATPDLRTDALSQPATPGSGRNFLLEIVSTPVANQAQARQLLLGQLEPIDRIVDSHRPHAHCRIVPRNGNFSLLTLWTLDANEGAAAGSVPSARFAVLLIGVPLGNAPGLTAYLDVFAQHSKYH
jgi:hypothetical protein